MAGLYYDIKIIGRCVIAGDIVTADFSGSGFEMNLNIAGGDVKLVFLPDKICIWLFMLMENWWIVHISKAVNRL